MGATEEPCTNAGTRRCSTIFARFLSTPNQNAGLPGLEPPRTMEINALDVPVARATSAGRNPKTSQSIRSFWALDVVRNASWEVLGMDVGSVSVPMRCEPL